MLIKIAFRAGLFILSLIFFGLLLLFCFSKSNFINHRKKLNIILITIDALRPDHLGCYGYQRNTSPNIDRLSKEGVRFTTAISAGGWTVESVPALLTGTYSPTHQIRSWINLRNPQIKTFAQELAIRGYQCILWSNFAASLRPLDIKDGFQRAYMLNKDKHNKPACSEYILTSQIINRLKKQFRDSTFFFYVHYHGCHVPYNLPVSYEHMYLHDKFNNKPKFITISNSANGVEKYDGYGKIPYIIAKNNITDLYYYISQYDVAISYTDTQIGRLMESLKELGLDKNTLIILTADHGEAIGEHNTYFSLDGVYEEIIRVPLIIRFPKLFPKGKIITEQVSLIDIAPTIFDILGLSKPHYLQGKSLFTFIKPFRIHQGRYIFSSCRECLTLRTESWKLIKDDIADSYELYNLKHDPQELRNLVTERHNKLKQLKQELENLKKCATSLVLPRKGPELSDENKERLRSLGYVQ